VNRRNFVVTAAAAAGSLRRLGTSRLGRVVVFQGDSITADGRDPASVLANDPAALGAGYPLLIASQLLAGSDAGAWRCFNRAVGGDKVPDLAARWTTDTLALEPDLISVLIGVNDYWHKQRGYTGTVADYEQGYGALLQATRQALPRARLVVLEPFVLRCGVVKRDWFPEFDQRRAAAARVAERANATFVALQSAFDTGAARTGPEHWAPDGVHPSPAGHALIAERWRAVVAA